MNSAVICIGDELLIGQVVNTNATWLGERLSALGTPLDFVLTVGDDEHAILRAFGEATADHSIVIATGGLGPTHDDVTKAAACIYFGTDLVESREVLSHIVEMFSRRGTPLTSSNRTQAMVPRGCSILTNPDGTAPGMHFTRSGMDMFFLPGVPAEMKMIFENEIEPFLKNVPGRTAIHQRTLNTAGIAESLLSDRLGDIDAILHGEARLAFLPSARGVRMRITVESETPQDAQRIVSTVESRIRAKVERYIYGVEGETLEEAVGAILRRRHLRLATAESCTGGLVANLITNVAGSSDYFIRGYITYSNEAKTELLGVPADLIAANGAVSEEVARAMALGARLRANADIAIATTGIAGPGGGSEDKPIGLVWIGFSDQRMTIANKYVFGSDRMINKERFAVAALDTLRRTILDIENE